MEKKTGCEQTEYELQLTIVKRLPLEKIYIYNIACSHEIVLEIYMCK